MEALRFVLDHNFPPPLSVKWPHTVQMWRLDDFDVRLTRGFDDWQVMLALHQRGDVDALVTQDANILSLPTEMYVLSQIRLSLVVTDDSGQSPFRATGLLMAGLELVAQRMTHEKHSIYRLSMKPRPVKVDDRLDKIAAHQRVTPPELIANARAETGDLAVPVVPAQS